MDSIKIIFMGTPDFGLPILKALKEKYDIVGVVCQPDKPSNRGEILSCPIKKYAIESNIKVFQPTNIKEDYFEILKCEPDLIITCAYGQIIPNDMLKFPRLGCINVHASLLPKYRGGAPIHRVILNGEEETGVTIMKMSERMDAGDIISQKSIMIDDTDTVGTLHDKLSILGRDLLMETLPSIIDGTATYTKQNEEEATFGYVIKSEDEHIDFSHTTREVINRVRGLNPYPGAYTLLSGRRVKIYNAIKGDGYYSDALDGQIVGIYDDGIGVKTSNGEVIFTELQLEGKKKMSAKDFINGVVNKDMLMGRMFE